MNACRFAPRSNKFLRKIKCVIITGALSKMHTCNLAIYRAHEHEWHYSASVNRDNYSTQLANYLTLDSVFEIDSIFFALKVLHDLNNN